MRYWWVNHKQTFDHEVGNGYIWCPKRKKDDTINHFYETLREVQKGDLIFSFAHAHLQAVGVAKLPCYSCPRPNEFGKIGDAWNERGWRVDASFHRFPKPLKITTVAPTIAPLLPQRYSPIRPNGHGNQGAYLAEISHALARRLIELADPILINLVQPSTVREDHEVNTSDPIVLTEWEDTLQAKIAAKEGLPETTRKALIQARRGQGLFKQNVARFEYECRITHVFNPTHLIASHIKPWRESDDAERLAGGNGLLLTPSIDHLFDRGFISFGDEGEVLVSPVADTQALMLMGVDCDRPLFSGRFHSDQKHFLDYHRKEIFLKAAL
ncbi:MAG: HNH endonuclease signature motif containing protein [Verrucomicrobiaceae bacterium]